MAKSTIKPVDPARFNFSGKMAMRLQDGDGALKAYFNFQDSETGLEYKDWRLVSGSNGLFISSPTGPEYKKDNKTIRPPYIQPAYNPDAQFNKEPQGVAYFDALLTAVVAEYEERGGDANAAPAKSRHSDRAGWGPAGKAPQRGGAGPVGRGSPPPKKFGYDPESDDDSLPF